MLCLLISQQPIILCGTTASPASFCVCCQTQAHGQNDHGACRKLQLHPHHRERNTQQVTTPQKQRPTGISLGPLLYNIYTYDVPILVSQKYAYADDLAFMHSAGDWQAIKGALGQDQLTLLTYFQTWRLKLSWSKTVLAALSI